MKKIEFQGAQFPDLVKSKNYTYPEHFRSAWDDFTMHIPAWEEFFNVTKMKGQNDLRFLELGTAQGRATVWLLENILTGNNCKIYTVDANTETYAINEGNSLIKPFVEKLKNGEFVDEIQPNLQKILDSGDIDNILVKYNVQNNLKPYVDTDRCVFFNMYTYPFFMKLLQTISYLEPGKNVYHTEGESSYAFFDFVYIDASHTEEDVLSDAILSFRFLKLGGTIIFDDYKCSGRNSHPGIDAFLEIHKEYLNIMYKEYQVYIQKIKDF